MATNMTIKRYNGSSWEEYNPSTTIAQVSGLQTALNGKQATLTFDSAPTLNSNNPVKSGGVYTAISNVMEVAEGKTRTSVTTLFPHTENSVTTYYLVAGNIAIPEGTTITWSSSISTSEGNVTPCFASVSHDETSITEFNVIGGSSGQANYLYAIYEDAGAYKVYKNIEVGGEGVLSSEPIIYGQSVGDILLITDVDYPDFWFANGSGSAIVLSKMETSKVDLSGYVPTSRTINGMDLSTDITLTASDVSALPSSTTYIASASKSGNTLTITPSSGSAITYTPTIPTNYLSDTPTSRSDSDSNTTYVIGKGSTSATGTNYYNSKVYFKGDDLYATTFNASNSLQLSSLSTADANGLSNQNGDLYWKTSKVVTGNYIKSASSSNNVLTLTNQSDSTTTFTNNTTYIGSSTPSNAHSGDIWFVTA